MSTINNLELPNTEDLIKQALDMALDFFQEDKIKEAEVVLKQLLRVDNVNQKGMQLLGLVYYKQENYQEAVKLFSSLLKMDNKNAENHGNVALCYMCMGFVDKAITHSEKAIELDPKNSNYYGNMGLQYRQKGDLDKAIDLFKKSISLKKDNFHVWANLGSLYGYQKKMDKAKECFEKSIELNPDYDASYVDLAHIHFLTGNYQEGWPLYEHRLSYFPPAQVFKQIYDPSKRWDGKQSLEGKKIVVYCEQGRGDLIHFIRFLPNLNKLGAKVCLHTPWDMASLIKGLDCETKRTYGDDDYDYHCSIVSLPHLTNTIEGASCPYLKCEKKVDLNNYSDKFKIGIAWAGNPQHPADRIRSCKLSFFKKIHDLKNVKLFNLQKDLRPRAYADDEGKIIDLAEGCDRMQIVDLSEHLESFEETAAFINGMDLIVSVDTAVLHLAGALGKTAWGLIPYNPDWRWGIEGQKTIWYPSLTLYRQKQPNEWQNVFNEIYENLISHLG